MLQWESGNPGSREATSALVEPQEGFWEEGHQWNVKEQLSRENTKVLQQDKCSIYTLRLRVAHSGHCFSWCVQFTRAPKIHLGLASQSARTGCGLL